MKARLSKKRWMARYSVIVSGSSVHLHESVDASSLSAAAGKALRKVFGKDRKGTLNEPVTIQVVKTSTVSDLQDLTGLEEEEPTLF